MKIKLYQINLDRDTESRAFMSWEWIAQKTENITDIDSSIYDCVFDGEIDGNSLEDAFAAFNFDHPDGFQGRSMSVSDIVVIEAEDGTTSAHFCDTIGFQQVEFDTEAAHLLKEAITVVIQEPGKMARVGTIEATLAGMQNFVGGYIEACYPFEEEVCIVCNEEGKINGLPLNRAIYVEDDVGKRPEEKQVLDIIAGPCFICDCSGENFGNLTDEQARKYMEMFQYPEIFFRIDGEIKAIPFRPEKEQER